MPKSQKHMDEESFTAYWLKDGQKRAQVHAWAPHSIAIAAWMAAKEHERKQRRAPARTAA